MFKRADSEFSTFSWLVFGLLGIVFSIATLSAPGLTTPIHIIQTTSIAFVVFFGSIQLLRLLTNEGLQE